MQNKYINCVYYQNSYKKDYCHKNDDDRNNISQWATLVYRTIYNNLLLFREWNIRQCNRTRSESAIYLWWRVTESQEGQRSFLFLVIFIIIGWSPLNPSSYLRRFCYQVLFVGTLSGYTYVANQNWGQTLGIFFSKMNDGIQNQLLLLEWTTRNKYDVVHRSLKLELSNRRY